MRCVVSVAVLVLLTGCSGGGTSSSSVQQGPSAEGFEFTSSSAVADGASVDPRFTCDGPGTSPALAWRGVPDGAEELALVVEDPDAPGGTFTHWLVYGLDPETSGLPAGATPDGQGVNGFGNVGYGGPCPPGGEEHRYVFRLLALHARSGLATGADRSAFDEAVRSHLLAEARLTATYARR